MRSGVIQCLLFDSTEQSTWKVRRVVLACSKGLAAGHLKHRCWLLLLLSLLCVQWGAFICDILIRGLWSRGTDCTIDVRITDVDAKSDRYEELDKTLVAQGGEKKRRSASGPASSNVGTFLRLWFLRMVSGSC